MTTEPNTDLPELARIAGSKALEAWNLKAERLELISQGENLVYQLDATNGERYALRVHRPGYHTVPALESEQLWTSALNDAGILVPIGQPRVDGGYYESIPVCNDKDIRQIGLVAWLDGKSLHEIVSEGEDPGLLLNSMKETGRIAGLIHNHSSKWQIPANFVRHELDAEGFMGESPFWGPFWSLPELSPGQRELFLSVKQALFNYLSDLNKSPEIYGMLHADLHGGNLLVSEQGITVIDFDDAGYGWHPYELAVVLHHLQEHKDFASIYRHLIEGYRSVRPITQSQLDQIPVFLLIRTLASIGWCHARREFDRSDYLVALIERGTRQSQLFLSNQLGKMFKEKL